MDVKYGPATAVQHISLLACRLLSKSFQSESQPSKSSETNAAGWESALASSKLTQRCCLLYLGEAWRQLQWRNEREQVLSSPCWMLERAARGRIVIVGIP